MLKPPLSLYVAKKMKKNNLNFWCNMPTNMDACSILILFILSIIYYTIFLECLPTGVNLHSLSKCLSHWLCSRSSGQPYGLLGQGSFFVRGCVLLCQVHMHRYGKLNSTIIAMKFFRVVLHASSVSCTTSEARHESTPLIHTM